MDPRSGELLKTRVPGEPGERLTEAFLREIEDRTEDEERALEKLRAGDPLIAVSDDVAHAQAVGQRELGRRRRRSRKLKGIAGY